MNKNIFDYIVEKLSGDILFSVASVQPAMQYSNYITLGG